MTSHLLSPDVYHFCHVGKFPREPWSETHKLLCQEPALLSLCEIHQSCQVRVRKYSHLFVIYLLFSNVTVFLGQKAVISCM